MPVTPLMPEEKGESSSESSDDSTHRKRGKYRRREDADARDHIKRQKAQEAYNKVALKLKSEEIVYQNLCKKKETQMQVIKALQLKLEKKLAAL